MMVATEHDKVLRAYGPFILQMSDVMRFDHLLAYVLEVNVRTRGRDIDHVIFAKASLTVPCIMPLLECIDLLIFLDAVSLWIGCRLAAS